MAPTICPTVTAQNAEEYKQQIEKVAGFALRIHIDVADGIFTPVKLTPIDRIWWPGGVRADVHVMYQKPFEYAELLIGLEPQLIIVHAEAEGDFMGFAEMLHKHGIEVGVALKAETSVRVIEPALDLIDHVLIFSGHLGHFGGKAETHLLTKVLHLKQIKPSLEIGWDGGINEQNAATLAAGGVDVLNTGGFIQHAADPAEAYHTLEKAVKSLRGKHHSV
jgi:ribulose-phosphate 3-epimerase